MSHRVTQPCEEQKGIFYEILWGLSLRLFKTMLSVGHLQLKATAPSRG